MSLRDWLIAAGIVLVIVIAADGIRRMRKRGKLQLKIDKQYRDFPEDDLSAELPNGGARPVNGPNSTGDTDEDVDLLMAGDLKGVGSGADEWIKPKKKPLFKYQDKPVTSESPAPEEERIEPVFTADDVDLLDDEPLQEPVRERLMAEDSEGLDDDILGPVRVRKVVTTPEPPTQTAELEEIHAQAPAEPETEIEPAPVEEPVTHEPPLFAVVDEPAQEPDYDFNRPITELMADRIPQPEPAAEPEPVAASTEAKITETKQSEDQSPEAAAQPPVEEAPLVAERREPEPDQRKSSKKSKKGKKSSRIQRWKEEIQTSFFDIDPGLDPETDDEEAKPAAAEAKPLPSNEPELDETHEPAEPQEPQVLAMTVTARSGFHGTTLFKLVEACGMEFGDMDIFHRHEEGTGQGPIQFSMVNGVKPGHFNPDYKEDFTTPAVSFFLQMDEPNNLMNAFDCMLGTAQCVADNLDGVLKDENHSVMRAQTIEHYRQQIRDYERRRLARRA